MIKSTAQNILNTIEVAQVAVCVHVFKLFVCVFVDSFGPTRLELMTTVAF